MNWINAKENAPTKEGKYLVWINDTWEQARWLMNQWIFYKDVFNREAIQPLYYLDITPPEEEEKIKKIAALLEEIEGMLTEKDERNMETMWIGGKMYHLNKDGRITQCKN